MTIRLLDVKAHQQDTEYYCGAACAQMVIATLGTGPGILDQDDLYTSYCHDTVDVGVNWKTAPDGLTQTMNAYRPPTKSFNLFALNTEESISRKICWTICQYQVAPIALVLDSGHWIVVLGYDASADPSSAADNTYSIDA